MPHIHSYAEKYGDKIKFTSLNTTKARRLAIGQKILGLPVIAIYKDGEKVEELVKDDATPEAVEEMIKNTTHRNSKSYFICVTARKGFTRT